MKNVISYIFSCILICTYMVVSLGFSVNTCLKEGSSRVNFFPGKLYCCSTCSHNWETTHNETPHCCIDSTLSSEPHEECCGCNSGTTGKRCCESSVCILNIERTIANSIEITIPSLTWELLFTTVLNNFYIFYDSGALIACSAPIVFGSGRSLSTFAPLRC